MGEIESLILTQFAALRERVEEGFAAVRTEQALTSRKIGAMAESMVSVSTRLDDLSQQMHMVALAVDEHTTRLDRVDKCLDATRV